jgi:tetratricopeptide (TPR) repeat protein
MKALQHFKPHADAVYHYSKIAAQHSWGYVRAGGQHAWRYIRIGGQHTWRGTRTTYSFLQRQYRRYQTWKNRPPTAKETQRAKEYMQLAYSLADDDYWNKDKYRADNKYREFNNQLDILTNAAKAMRSARRLDPNATIEVAADKGGTTTITHDYLSGRTLYQEGLTHYYIATNHYADAQATVSQDIPTFENVSHFRSWKASRDHYVKEFEKDGLAAITKAIPALEKSLIYNPHSVLTLNLLAQCYLISDRTKKRARQMIQKSLDLNPANVDTMKIAQKVGLR